MGNAWILDLKTRKVVWELSAAATERGRRSTQVCHRARADPLGWGLLIRVADAGARAAVKPFTYEHVPANATIVARTRVGDRESRARGFTLNRPMDVRIYALGEGRDGHMVDYGWITSVATRQKVWEMRYPDTESAGGDPKNRLFDRALHLEKGDYVVHYVTDDSHAYDAWNASAPFDGQHWGITLLAAHDTLDRAAVSEYAEKPDPSIIAQMIRLRNDENPRTRFTLDRESQVRIYALGEGVGREMADYGWIEDAKTGRTAWEMTYRTTEPAGGAEKNRRFNGTITLPAGEYVLRFETDGSHAFGAWTRTRRTTPTCGGSRFTGLSKRPRRRYWCASPPRDLPLLQRRHLR